MSGFTGRLQWYRAVEGNRMPAKYLIAARVPADQWEHICREIEAHYRAGRFGAGSVAGVLAVGGLLARHFPGGRPDANELPNQPVLL